MSMTIGQHLAHELEMESKTTRRFLEQLPDDKLGWKPHEKSLSAGALALHIATIPAGITAMGEVDECPMPDFSFEQPANRDEVLAKHDEGVAEAIRILGGIDDARMTSDWSLVVNGQAAMTMPRAAFFRGILLNHLYHHRGQFGVYLRLMGVTVPYAYGPSGDEVPPDFEKVMALMSK
jgi:uncharacterized damage-inducible protein DinB